jgi:hypothetical protein
LLAGTLAAGCQQPIEPPSPETPPSQESVTHESASGGSSQADLSVLRYDTGDVKEWPDYDFPLEHSFECPEVPPEVVGPFSADDIPATADEP